MDIETKRKISRSMKGKSNFEGKKHTHATKIQIGFSQEGHRNAKDHKWVTDKETGEEHRVKGNVPKGMRKGRTRAFSQWIHAKENFEDGRNPQDKGDMARHGLKNKTMAQLKKIRGSDTASPRQKQLAHWYINMHKEETVAEDLRKWFSKTDPKGGWKRINSKGEPVGPCAREPGEPKPKCMSNEKIAALSKKERAAAVAAKRRHDPDPERQGKPINVSNFGKGKISEDMENLEEKSTPTNPGLWSRAKALARSKFDVYPSAYANGWAAKWYKGKGGGWKTANEETSADRLEGTKSLAMKYLKDTPGQGKKSMTKKIDEVNVIDVPAYKRKPLTLDTLRKALTKDKMGNDKISHKDVLAKNTGVKEETVNELSKETLKSYTKGAALDSTRLGNMLGRLQVAKSKTQGLIGDRIATRLKGIGKATDKLAKK